MITRSLVPSALLLALVAGCNSVKAVEDTSPYEFVLGPSGEMSVDGPAHSIKIAAPARFVDVKRSSDHDPIQVSQFTMPFHYPEMTPVARDKLGDSNVVLATFAWEPPGGVRRRIDGSWLNHFSRYSVKGDPAFGLKSAKAPDPIDTSVLFSSIEEQVLIECNSINGEPLQYCHLISNPMPYMAFEARFRADYLPQWRAIMKAALSIVSIHRS
jgi:hypothetical protein